MDTDSLQAVLDELTKMRASARGAAHLPKTLTTTRGPPAMRHTLLLQPRARYPKAHTQYVRLCASPPPSMAISHKRQETPMLAQEEEQAGHISQCAKITLLYRFAKRHQQSDYSQSMRPMQGSNLQEFLFLFFSSPAAFLT
jgi:hypothetical protein